MQNTSALMMKEQNNIIYYFLSVKVIDTQQVICFKTQREPAAKLIMEDTK